MDFYFPFDCWVFELCLVWRCLFFPFARRLAEGHMQELTAHKVELVALTVMS